MHLIQKTKLNNNKYQFIVKSMDGGILLRSKSFVTENEIDQTIAQMTQKQNSNISIERTTNYLGQFQFRLKNKSKSIIGFSQPYSSEAGMENGIKNLNKSIYNSKSI